jgi:hypothetical protein
MFLIVKILIAAAVVVPLVYMGETIAIVLVTPLVAILFVGDLIEGGTKTIRAMRRSAFKGDARVYQFGFIQVRMIEHSNRVWFSALSVCKALGYDDVQYTIRHYATTDYQIFGAKKEPFLSESGVQKLAALSRHADAPAFQKWFDGEVLATLPKTRRRMKSASPSADAL